VPTLTINGQSVRVAEGETILDAARGASIDIPTLCWYPKLPTAGNCRICLVSVEGSGKLLPSCATTAAEGMVVTTESDAAVANRRSVLSMLLERYPVERIHADGARNEFEALVHRYDMPTAHRAALPLRKGDHRLADPMILHDMSTCILCTRCVRACEDIQVVGVLDVAGRGADAHIIVGAHGDRNTPAAPGAASACASVPRGRSTTSCRTRSSASTRWRTRSAWCARSARTAAWAAKWT